MRSLAALTLAALAVAPTSCKDKQQGAAPAAKPSAGSNAAPTTAPEKPATPAAAEAEQVKPNKPITIAEATAALPAIVGNPIIALKQTSDQQQVHGTWCIDGTSADDVAKQVGHLLAQASYANLTIKGDARKAGVMGDRQGLRFSMVVSASSAAVCAAPAHYFASATIFKL
ncbi:MAG TPA: hypothetical protein VIV40_03815 [Kofleriaceae bacterium]